MLKLRSFSVTSRIACLIAAVLACAAATTPAVMAGASADGGSIAIRAGRIYPASLDLPAMIEDGVIVIRDGRIEAIGADIDPPADLPLVEYPDASITPGMVAVSAEVAGEHRGLDSVGAGFWALDAFDRYADWRPMLASGVTTAHLSPGSNKLLSGRGAVVRFAAHDDPHAVLVPMSDLTVNLHEGVYNPPSLVEALIPPSADNLIEPGRPQRPDSRIGLYVALKDAVESALSSSDRSLHQSALASAWTEGAPIRIHADRAADLLGATTFLQTNDRRGYLVGGAESARIAERLRDAGYPLVYGLDASFRAPGNDLGASRDAVERNVRDLAALDGLKLALTVAPGGRAQDLRLAASTAQRSGMDAGRVLESVTRIPAEILGVDDHVGSLAPGKLADLVLHSGDPLETRSHVLGVYLSGTPMFRAPNSDAVVVRAGTVWLGPDEYVSNGSILIEDGKIAAVGRSVPQPPFARVVDAGADGFVTPGFIDAGGRLGLGNARATLDPELSPSKLFGAADLQSRRIARAGVTTVLVGPARASGQGSQISAVKTDGVERDERIVADTAAVLFDVSDVDPIDIESRLKGRIEAGRAYFKKWEKWREDYAAWEQALAEGLEVDTEPQIEVVEEGGDGPDPLTGTWFASISGGPLPQPLRGNVGINLKGTSFEGKILEPAAAEIEHTIRGTLDGDSFSGEIEIDTGGLSLPTFEGEITSEDQITGTLSFQNISLTLEAERTDRSAVTFAVKKKRRTTGKDGEPLPPLVNEGLEPIRAVLEGRIPLAVRVRTARQIDAVLDYVVDTEKLAVVLVDAEDAGSHADRLKEAGVGVVTPREVIRRERFVEYHQGADLSRSGVRVAMQSEAEDGARTLPMVGLFAVERGMSPDAALSALTHDAAAMFKLDDRIGSIAPGRDADLIIFTGHPFEAGTSIKRVLVGGEEVR